MAKQTNEQGFTIIELLISSLVFSIVLLAVTMGIIQITRVYYKGVTESNTQNTTRTIVDTISQAIQFNGGVVSATQTVSPGTATAFCAGGQQISYVLGYRLTGTNSAATYEAAHSLVQTANSGCTGNPTANTSGRELLATNMRLSQLQVTTVGNDMYKIHVRVAYGDNDLLYSPSSPSAANGSTLPDAQCKSGAGSQFCSISELTTTVVKRVQ